MGRIVVLRFGTTVTVTAGNNLLLTGNMPAVSGSTLTLACSREGTYTTGTVTATNASATVTGAGTTWTGTLQAGHYLEIAGIKYLIASVDSNTQVTLVSTYTGTTAAGVAYVGHQTYWREIARDNPVGSTLATRTVSATTDTLVLADAGKVIECTNGGAVTVTVPPNSSVAYPVNSTIEILQVGAGQVTVAAGAGVTVNGASGLKTRAQWSTLSLRKRAAPDAWVLVGDAAV
jgi:hypothetical protein